MAKKKSTTIGSSSSLRNNKLIFLAMAIVVALAFVGVLFFLRNIYRTEVYWVLNQDLPGSSQVRPGMLSPITVSEGGAPPGLVGMEAVQTGNVFTQWPLRAGDTLTMSNVGTQQSVADGIPDTWVVTSFSLSTDAAAGGRIGRGIYFDLMVVGDDLDGDGVSGDVWFPFVNLLALDATVAGVGAETDAARQGAASLYWVGMTPGDAARLQSLVSSGQEIILVLSPRQNTYAPPELEEYEGVFSWVQWRDTGPQNMSLDTRVTGEDGLVWRTGESMLDLARDEWRRPLDIVSHCGLGNALVAPDPVRWAGEPDYCPPGMSLHRTPRVAAEAAEFLSNDNDSGFNLFGGAGGGNLFAPTMPTGD